MQITNQKRIAARLLKCGVNRVWINPSFVDQVASAVQTDDIREFIDEGWIKAKPVKGTSRVRARARLEQKKKGRRKSTTNPSFEVSGIPEKKRRNSIAKSGESIEWGSISIFFSRSCPALTPAIIP